VDAFETLATLLPDGAVSTHPGELALRARDWWALAMLRQARGERLDPPAGVAFPRSADDVSTVLTWAQETGTAVVPRGGGSGVCGGGPGEPSLPGSGPLQDGQGHRQPFMEDELGAGLEALRAVKAALDPAGILNPGKLLPGGA
jgi:FAD/FMN-containing dehydrogenase